jgi:hypothetical protein
MKLGQPRRASKYNPPHDGVENKLLNQSSQVESYSGKINYNGTQFMTGRTA